MARLSKVQTNTRSETLTSLNLEIRRLRGRILNLHRILANNEDALRAFMAMSRYVRDESSLPGSLRELAIVTVAHALNDEYELHQHRPIARELGITEVQLKEIADWPKSTSFSKEQRAVIAFASECTVRRHVSDVTFARLSEHLSAHQIVDLALIVGWYQLCHVVIDALGVEIEPKMRRGTATGRSGLLSTKH
jgi:alkylhydroperoxidase family enzyme